MHYLGIDVGKNRCAVHRLDEDGNHLAAFQIQNSQAGYRDLTNRLDEPAHLKADTGHHGKAMAVARREVCELAYWLLTKQEPCEWADPGLLNRKLTEARRLASD